MSNIDIFLLVSSYFIGSIPFGYVIAKLSGIGDIRKQGSGNIGATNLLRVGGKLKGLLTLLLDASKGVVVVLLARNFLSEDKIIAICAFLAVFGHVFPIWLKFKGGKGVATTLAVVTAIYWPIGVIGIIFWLLIFTLSGISSLSAILAMFWLMIEALILLPEDKIVFTYLIIALNILVIICHKENIIRLIKRKEKPVI